MVIKHKLSLEIEDNYTTFRILNGDDIIYTYVDRDEFSQDVPEVVAEVLRCLGYIVEEEYVNSSLV